MAPLFGYCNKPSLGPWTRSPGTVPPSSCRYINSGAIIGVCAFSQSPLGPAAAPLSYSFYLCRFPLRLAPAPVVSTLSPRLSCLPSPLADLILPLPPFPLSSSSSSSYSATSTSTSTFTSSSTTFFFLFFSSSAATSTTSLAHPLTRPPYPSAAHSPPRCGSLHRP